MIWRLGSLLAALVVLLCPLAASASDLNGPEDFAQISRQGFSQTVNGSYVSVAGSLFPNLPNNAIGSGQNSYAWGMEWFARPGQDPALWVGTVRNLLCFLSPGSLPSCPLPTEGLPLPLPDYTRDRAEIWRYDPAGLGGISGTWTRVFQSPQASLSTRCALGAANSANPAVTYLFCNLGLTTAPSFPAHIGIRNLKACDAGGVNRLYAANLGLFSSILYLNDAGQFVAASSAGATFSDLVGAVIDAGFDFNAVGELDLGYRSLSCWERPDHVKVLCTAPAAGLTDPDSSPHPWVLCNANPTNATSPWEPYSPLRFNDPDAVGVFDMAVVHVAPDPEVLAGEPVNYLCASELDRTNGGTVWCTDGTGCATTTPVTGEDYSLHSCEWTPVIANGAGRPTRYFGSGRGGPAGDPAAFGYGAVDTNSDGFHDYLVQGWAEAAGGPAAGNADAELTRIIFDRSRPDDFMKWEFLAGVPRVVSTPGVTAAELDTTLFDLGGSNLVCTPAAIPGHTGSLGCLPLAGRGLGFATSANPATALNASNGPASYFWRFAQHQADLFMGVFDLNGGDLYKSPDAGITWSTITTNGMGWVFPGSNNSTNYGFRTMVSTDTTPGIAEPSTPLGGEGESPTLTPLTSPVLFVGTANPYGPDLPEGGTQVFAGVSGGDFPPVAVPGADQDGFDNELCATFDACALPTGNGTHTFTLGSGSGSYDPFGGAGLTNYEWFAGAVPCNTVAPAGFQSATAVTFPMALASADPFMAHTMTLRVTDSDANRACATMIARSWAHRPPAVGITTVPPGRFTGTRPRVFLVDFDNDGQESFKMHARCRGYEALQSCTKSFENLGSQYFLSDSGVLATGVDEFEVTVTLKPGSANSPDIDVTALDAHAALWTSANNPYAPTAGIDAQIIGFVNTAGNDAPACASGEVVAIQGVQLVYNPQSPAPGHPKLCEDPDPGTTLSFGVDGGSDEANSAPYLPASATPGQGQANLQYLSPTSGKDAFLFAASDGSLESPEVNLDLRVVYCDLTEAYTAVSGVTLTNEDRSACIAVIATDTLVAGTTNFTAGEGVTLGNGFRVGDGSTFTAILDPGLLTP